MKRVNFFNLLVSSANSLDPDKAPQNSDSNYEGIFQQINKLQKAGKNY